MGFGIYHLIQAALLVVNAIAILNEERFLKKIGFDFSPEKVAQGGIKSQMVNLLNAVRTLLRAPLIIINSVVIVFALILG